MGPPSFVPRRTGLGEGAAVEYIKQTGDRGMAELTQFFLSPVDEGEMGPLHNVPT
jgi:hypothetical protein